MKIAIGVVLLSFFIIAAIAQTQSGLYGCVKFKNYTPARGVIVSIGSYSVSTNADGCYKLAFLKPGVRVVSVSPPGKPSRSYRVTIGRTPTEKNFTIDW